MNPDDSPDQPNRALGGFGYNANAVDRTPVLMPSVDPEYISQGPQVGLRTDKDSDSEIYREFQFASLQAEQLEELVRVFRDRLEPLLPNAKAQPQHDSSDKEITKASNTPLPLTIRGRQLHELGESLAKTRQHLLGLYQTVEV